MIAIRVGVLRGVQVLRSDLIRGIKGDLRGVVRAFESAESFTADTKTKDIEAIASTIADLSRITGNGRQLVVAEADFLASDWSPLPFLVRDDSERTKLAREVIKHAGNPGGRDKAKQWLTHFENQLKERHGVDRLEIAY